MHTDPPIAVVGMDGIFPGAPDLETFWTHIVDGVDQSKPVPEERWIAPVRDRLGDRHAPDRTYSRNACLIEDLPFNASEFSLDATVTEQLDPVHKLTLTAGKRAFDACQTSSVPPEYIDVILAAIALPTDSASAFSRKIFGQAIEEKLFPNRSKVQEFVSTPEALSSRVDGLPAALLAAELGAGGNSFTLDAACASSMYALKLACDALWSHRAAMVVTGGVSRPECLYTQTGFSQLQALSPSGRCAPFDRGADGLVVGEGIGILILKRLEDAVAQGDTIHGVIHGIGLSNDMRGNLLAPESDGQLRAMRHAYERAGWRPSDVDLIECHGTGTPAGDTTEVQSLVRLWRDEPVSDARCAIGSVKSGIGHLLTAAGAAGMIKTLLALHHRTLPPSIHFEAPPKESPLHKGPFYVQTRPEPWTQRRPDTPRRAAVSAFGFGGINAHVLFEQWIQPPLTQAEDARAGAIELQSSHRRHPNSPVAIVGMETYLGRLNGLAAFRKALMTGDTAIGKRPAHRWKETDETIVEMLDGLDPEGAFMDAIGLDRGEFKIPPNELTDILPQQLLAMKVGAGALQDAGLPLREPRERMGVVVGIEFDFEATNFHVRWHLADKVRHWNKTLGLKLDETGEQQWLENLRKRCFPPLTAPRVMGALGGIVASRMAREFRFGGPSFVVSGNTASGIQALRVAVDQLKDNSVDAMLVGSVDLAGEARNVIRLNRFCNLSRENRIRPFDDAGDGILPGDGAVALVLKRWDQAQSDKDRVYAVIENIGCSGGGDPLAPFMDKSAYGLSLSNCLSPTSTANRKISLVMAHGTGVPEQDSNELDVLDDYFSDHGNVSSASAIALGSITPVSGLTGAAQGLFSLAATALCLDQRKLPPLVGFRQGGHKAFQSERFHVPREPQPWFRDRVAGLRYAVSACITTDGTASHVLLREPDRDLISQNRFVPAVDEDEPAGLFVITGPHAAALSQGLETLDPFLTDAGGRVPIQIAAANWIRQHPPSHRDEQAIALVIGPDEDLKQTLREAKMALDKGFSDDLNRRVFYNHRPLGADAPMAFVYPGSGNHYLGMGRELALRFPEIIEQMDQHTKRLKSQFRPRHLMPWRNSWENGWQTHANANLNSDPLNMIFGQVVFGGLMTNVLKTFEIQPNAVIGYSLGESAALFANGIWKDRGDMLEKMQTTDLFTTQLAGPCQALRTAWNLSPNEPAEWSVAVVNRSEEIVRNALKKIPHARLLIVNTPDECVIGGLAPRIQQSIAELRCQAVFLDGVVTVHCDAASPVAQAYRDLHLFPVQPTSGITVYSCSWSDSYDVTADNIADSIKKQAVDGFHFPNTIQKASEDGIGIFVEAGPRASCTRMVDRILSDRTHLAVAANHGNENEIVSLLRCLARLATERVPMNLRPLYAPVDTSIETVQKSRTPAIKITTGGQALRPARPGKSQKEHQPELTAAEKGIGEPGRYQPPDKDHPEEVSIVPPDHSAVERWKSLIEQGQNQMEETASAHRRFLKLSEELTRAYAETFDLQNRLMHQGAMPVQQQTEQNPPPVNVPNRSVAFDREQCMAFAVGKVGKVLGPSFDVVDTYRVRVRLPDEPLMLVDRILSIQGEMGSMGSGTVITEHDVHPGAWYLDGDRAPVCISVEAGQADLFLSSYLGIDHRVKGKRAYRLLDAVVTFHRGLPRPGDTVRYEITIDKFVRQGETWMFFFRFEGTIGDQHLITMQDGCAGFFTEAEVLNSGGILLTEEERSPAVGKTPPDWHPPAPMEHESFTDAQVDALRSGDLVRGFGSVFQGRKLAKSLYLPGGRMRLIHRIVELNPTGGRYGIGMIRAEADIRPDDWFLTCHFVDDMVMPGTLMYECCAHTLRVYLQRMGWVTDKPGVCYEPLIGNGARLKCRGPVTPETRHVHYEIQISEIGFGPEPYVIADAHMFADDRFIVFFKDMSMKMTGIHRDEIESQWAAAPPEKEIEPESVAPTFQYDKGSILAFAVGNPSEAFGEPYRIFDKERKIARLPGPPYCFMDRVLHVEPEAWILRPDGWVTAQYDVPPEAWYFSADRSGVMPFCVLLEIALQPCGWLAAYAGSALRSSQDLKFRNLGGSAVLHRQVQPDTGTLTMRCRMTKVSEAADMIIENFDFEVLSGKKPLYTGETYFGFFSSGALNQQKGLGDTDPLAQAMSAWSSLTAGAESLPLNAPATPGEAAGGNPACDRLSLPSKALLMIDSIEACDLAVNSKSRGYVRGVKRVDPEEWFFKAHFYQDPVCPGSLGIESFIQLMKFAALKQWPHLAESHRFRVVENSEHRWSYRGQIVPKNKKIVVQARITSVQEGPAPQITAHGMLAVDGLPIYKMENFKLALVPAMEPIDGPARRSE